MKNTNKPELINKLYYSLFLTTDKYLQTQLKEKLINSKHFTNSEVVLLASKKKLEMLPDVKLFWIAKLLEEINNKIVTSSDYFHESEIQKFLDYKTDDEIVLNVFEDVWLLAKGQWLCRVSVYNLGLMFNKAVIKRDNDIRLRNSITSNKQRVNEISDMLIDGTFKFNTLRVNLLEDTEATLKFDILNRVITLPENGDLVCVDGNARLEACLSAITRRPDLKEYFSNVYFGILLTNYNLDDLKNTLVQEFSYEPVSKEKILFINTNIGNKIFEKFKNNKNLDELFLKRLGIYRFEKHKNFKFISSFDLIKAIELNYNFEKNSASNKEEYIIKTSRWLTTFFNEVVKVKKNDFENTEKSLHESWFTSFFVTFGLVKLSKTLRGDVLWREKLNFVLKHIHWDKDSIPFKRTTKLTNETISLVENLFLENLNFYGDFNG